MSTLKKSIIVGTALMISVILLGGIVLGIALQNSNTSFWDGFHKHMKIAASAWYYMVVIYVWAILALYFVFKREI